METAELIVMFEKCLAEEDHATWNRFRRLNSKVKIDFSQMTLKERKIFKFNLTGVDFTKANLSQSTFERCILNNAHFEGAECFGVHFLNCSMVSASMVKANLAMAIMDTCDLRFSNFSDSMIHQVNMVNCQGNNANFTNASFNDTSLCQSNFKFSDLTSCEFSKVELHDSNFEASIVDGKTIIWDCFYNKNTNFTGVGLSSCRVEPVLMSSFQCNIRRIWWQEWYRNRIEEARFSLKDSKIESPKRALKYILTLGLTHIVKFFWWMTDYGSSTIRLLFVFLCSTLTFTLIYIIFPHLTNDILLNQSTDMLRVVIRALYFSIVVNTGLGFGEINASETSILGHIVISSHSLLGFILLGAFLVRIGILFQGEFPVASERRNDHTTRH